LGWSTHWPTFVVGPGSRTARCLVFRGKSLPHAIERNGNTVAYHANGHGGIVGLTNASKLVVQTYLTDEFGVTTVQQGDVGLSQPFLFTGEPYDDETNLLFLRAKFNHPEMGRFLSRDRADIRGCHGSHACPASLRTVLLGLFLRGGAVSAAGIVNDTP